MMMCIGEGFCVLCSDSIPDPSEKRNVINELEATGHELIEISLLQMHAFAGNMLHVRNRHDARFIIVSQSAFLALTGDQRKRLSLYGQLLPVDVSVIEKVEGGSVRCMIAEIFLQPRD